MSTSGSSAHRRRASLTARQNTDAYSQHLVLSPDAQWDKLLNAAPKALVCLGQAFVASTSKAVGPVQVEKTGPLESTSLRANLQHCADLGQEAFLEAEVKMTKLHKVARYIDNDAIGKVLRLCEDQPLARADLPRQIERLKKLSLDCVENTTGIQRKFEAWAHFAQIASGTLKGERFKQQNASDDQGRKLQQAKRSLIDHQRKFEASEERMDRAQREIPKANTSANEVGGRAVGIRAADGIMNSLSTIAESLNTAASAVTSLVASGGPTLNLKMNLEKTATAQSTSSAQAAAAAAATKAERKRRKDTLRRALEDYESSKRDFLECENLFVELQKQDQEAKDQFNAIQLQLQQLGQEQISIVWLAFLSIPFSHHITHIRRFFAQIHEHVATIDCTYLTDFVESADKLAQLPSTSSEQEIYQRRQQYYLEEIREDAEKLRESYVAAGEFASTYVEVSEKYIWPGVKEVNRLMLQGSRDNGMDVTAKVNAINRYARKAQSEVSKIATERREGVRNKLWDTKRPFEDLDEAIDRCGDLIEEDDEDEGEGEGEEEGTMNEERMMESDNVDAVGGVQEDEEDEEDDEWDNA
ncbi:MAG: hypothetical protein Q9225_007523, partial [Loekoesia sp. 1 TL-2023]